MQVVRRLKAELGRQLRRRLGMSPPEAERAVGAYVTAAPSDQNALDLFAGEWSSRLPEPLAQLQAGLIPLFNDDRAAWAIERLGGVDGCRVLELGPLEGGHTHQLLGAGAKEVLAIEAHKRAYLRCLITKEILGMDAARFLLGDFRPYLRQCDEHFDVCFASGVLYHLQDPVEALGLISRVASRLFVWTHYYAESIIQRSDELRQHFTGHSSVSRGGLNYTLHHYEYAEYLRFGGFCGGSAPDSYWLSREELFGALEHFGWNVTAVGFEDKEHKNGPALALVAVRASD